MLLAVPNISEGRDDATIDAVAEAFVGAAATATAKAGTEGHADVPTTATTGSPTGGGVHLLDVHRDPDHNRSVFTLAGAPGQLASALLAGGRVALERIDLRTHEGVHPHVGALDVAPIVHLDAAWRGAACAEALLLGDLLGRELELPVLLYGALAQGRTRAQLRRGGPAELARRIAAHELRPDFGPPATHASGGATLVAARPPLVAFNVTLAPPATLDQARGIAAKLREGGPEGISGLRAIGLELPSQQQIQLSMNVERPTETPLRDIVQAIRRHAQLTSAELVGLAPQQAFDGFPDDIPIPGFDPQEHLIEHALEGLR